MIVPITLPDQAAWPFPTTEETMTVFVTVRYYDDDGPYDDTWYGVAEKIGLKVSARSYDDLVKRAKAEVPELVLKHFERRVPKLIIKFVHKVPAYD